MFKYGYNCTQHQTFSPGRYLSCCSYVVHTKSNVNSCVRVMSRIKKWDGKRSSDPGSSPASAQLVSHVVKRVWMSDCPFRKVTEMFANTSVGGRGLFYHQKTQLDVRQLWPLWLSLEGDTHLCCLDVHHHHGDTRQLVWIHHCPISKHQHESEKQQFHYLPPGWEHASYCSVLVWHAQCVLRPYI